MVRKRTEGLCSTLISLNFIFFGSNEQEIVRLGVYVWRPQLITFPRASLVPRLTIDVHGIIIKTQATHPIPKSEVKCRLAKLALR